MPPSQAPSESAEVELKDNRIKWNTPKLHTAQPLNYYLSHFISVAIFVILSPADQAY